MNERKKIHVNDWVEFKNDDIEMGGLVTAVLDNDEVIVVVENVCKRMKVHTSTIVRVNYREY